MKNANYNLVKLLLAKLDDAWRVEQHYLKDAEDHDCVTCQELLRTILGGDREHIEALRQELAKHIKEDEFKLVREKINAEYHPYNDGNSALRMVETTGRFIAENGVPESRKLSFMRRRKIHKIFGKY